ncbi:MAG: B12-binding domain-containing radical SAM protein [Bryobacteraceae bacterium]
MDVLLTHSNHVFNDEKQTSKMEPYPPLQTLLAAAVLREAGFRVGLCDVTLEDPIAKFAEAVRRESPSLVVVCEDDFNFLTKMCLSKNRELAFWMARFAGACGCKTAVHGSDATDNSSAYLDAGFEFVLVGEVEETLRELAGGAAPQNISGLVYRDEDTGQYRRTLPRPAITQLDQLPLAAWDLIDIESYRNSWQSHHGYFSMNMASSRGCPYRCNWCAKPIHGKNYRVRSARSVAEEMLYLKSTHAPDHLWFADDIFALSPRWAHDFSCAVKELHAQVPFKMQSRCDLMTRQTVSDLKQAGCSEVWMGAESGSQRILDAMEKGTRVEQIVQATENLRRNGIRTGWFIQFGYPGETWDDLEATVQMLRIAKPDDVGVSVTYPLPGTKLYDVLSSQLGKKRNWVDSGDLTMMFRGAFSTEIYRAIAHAIHLEVRNPTNAAAIANAWAEVATLKPGCVNQEAVLS